MFYTHSMTNPVRALPMRVASYRLRADSFRKGSGGSSSLLHPRVLQKRVQGPLARIIAFRTPPLIHPSLPKQPSRDVHVPTDGYHLPVCTWDNGLKKPAQSHSQNTQHQTRQKRRTTDAGPWTTAPRKRSIPTTTEQLQLLGRRPHGRLLLFRDLAAC